MNDGGGGGLSLTVTTTLTIGDISVALSSVSGWSTDDWVKVVAWVAAEDERWRTK